MDLSSASCGFLALAFAVSSQDSPAPSADATPAVVVPREWLVLAPVDSRGRRPFNGNAPFGRHLLDRAAPPPKEGDASTGERGSEQRWTARQADDSGTVRGGPLQIAFTTVEWPEDGAALCELDGALTVWVNGTPQIGDLYGDVMGALPVAMKRGANAVFVTGMRGSFKLTFSRAPSPLIVDPFDATVSDVSPLGGPAAALLVMNATLATCDRLEITTGGDEAGCFERKSEQLPGLGPCAFRKIVLPIEPRREMIAKSTATTLELPVHVRAGPHAASTSLSFARRAAGALTRCAYVSPVDGSLQEIAVLPPSSKDVLGVVLTLHGAGVQAWNQAASYSQKPDFWIVAPTNRRPYGFDWQDWGRRDALDAIDALVADGVLEVRPGSLFLTGHSMGGHGTWHLAANHPDRFAAIAPSAGWAGFDGYGGGDRQGELADLWQSADGASRTMELLDNLKSIPTFVLHGRGDDNVPVSEGERMLAALRKAGGAPLHHFQEGAGHWWDGAAAGGADCVDWPGIFELFRSTARGGVRRDESFSFTTMDPAVESKCHGVEIVQPLEYGKPCRIDVAWDSTAGVGTITTSNVRRLALGLVGDDASRPWRIDGQPVDLPRPPSTRLPSRVRTRSLRRGPSFERVGSEWRDAAVADASQKSPARSGPFKRAFDRNFVLVHGTAGDAQEDRELLERARYDAAHWWYRANGHARVCSDVEYVRDLAATAFDNVILYGNEDTNAAWSKVLAAGCPIRVRRGELRCGERTWKGEALAALFVWPREESSGDGLHQADEALVGVIADTGPNGTRLGATIPIFSSGVGLPDYTLFSPDVLTRGDGAVLAAGWFDHEWRLPSAE